MFKKIFLDSLYKKQSLGGGIVQIVVLVLVVGAILLILLDGITTSVIVMKELDYKSQTKKLAISYFEELSRRAENKTFYDGIAKNDVPPVPLTSEYTLNGFYSVNVTAEPIDGHRVNVFISYKLSSDTSFSSRENIYSLELQNPAFLNN